MWFYLLFVIQKTALTAHKITLKIKQKTLIMPSYPLKSCNTKLRKDMSILCRTSKLKEQQIGGVSPEQIITSFNEPNKIFDL